MEVVFEVKKICMYAQEFDDILVEEKILFCLIIFRSY